MKKALQRAKLPALFSASLAILAGCCCAEPDVKTGAPLPGNWHVDYIEGAGVMDRSPAHYRFGEDMRLSGNASCNTFTGSYRIVDGAIEVGDLATTRRLCPPALMEQEERFLKTLRRAHSWDTHNGLMYLFDEQGTELFRGALWYDQKQ